MLTTLQAIHDESTKLVATMEQFTRAATPPARDALTSLRWQLTRLHAKRRRLLFTTVYPALTNLSEPDAERVKALRDDDVVMMAASSRHIQDWTVERIYADWPGYQAAAATMLGNTRARLARERKILFPLLTQAPLPLVA